MGVVRRVKVSAQVEGVAVKLGVESLDYEAVDSDAALLAEAATRLKERGEWWTTWRTPSASFRLASFPHVTFAYLPSSYPLSSSNLFPFTLHAVCAAIFSPPP